MCKDHDLQHYSIDLRNLAREICCGDYVMASRLLDMATHDGMAAFLNQYGDYCSDVRFTRIDGMMSETYTQRRHAAIGLAGEIVNAWEIDMDELPY